MHTHTKLSLCCNDEHATVSAYVKKAAELGIQVLGITNHCWDESVPIKSSFYNPQSIAYNTAVWDDIPKDTEGVKLLIGVETEYCGMTDTLGMTAEGAKNFQYVLVPTTHTHMVNFVIPFGPNYRKALDKIEKKLRETFPAFSDKQINRWMEAARPADVKLYSDGPDLRFVSEFMCESFLQLFKNSEFLRLCNTVPTFIAHPFCAGGYNYEENSEMLKMISDEKLYEMFENMASGNVGYDISVNNFVISPGVYIDQMFRLIRIAKECGVKFTFGTDAHTVDGLNNAVKSAEIYERAGFTPDDLHPFYREYVRFE